MVCSGALGFILLFLLHPALGFDNHQLRNIIDYLYYNYGVNSQFALGINVEDKYCQQGAVLDWNFLPQDNDTQKVTCVMACADRIYKGTRLIGARPKPIPGTQKNYHSEYLLLNQSMSQTLAQFDPLMQTLLNSDPKGCTVFYTLNSPCVNTCSTPNGPYSIIPALKIFQNRTRKAFVFSYVWHDAKDNPDWKKYLLKINEFIPVFRCDENGCLRCVKNGKVHQNCTINLA